MSLKNAAPETTAPTAEAEQPFDIEATRQKGVEENAVEIVKARQNMLEGTDDLISFLTTNRGHIAGLLVVCTGFYEDTLVDPLDKDTADCLVRSISAGAPYKAILKEEARKYVDGKGDRSGNPLAAIMAGLRR